MVAIEWSDIDFAKARMCVQQSAVEGAAGIARRGRFAVFAAGHPPSLRCTLGPSSTARARSRVMTPLR
jgi:hypothetical protein